MSAYVKEIINEKDKPKLSALLITNLKTKLNNQLKITPSLLATNIPLVIPSTYPYCYEVVKAVERSFKPFNFDVKLKTYQRREKDGQIDHCYLFTVINNNALNDDLPF